MSRIRERNERTPIVERASHHALRQLINRTDRVLAVLHPPSATLARIMEKAGCGVFVGTGGVVGAYTGSPTSAP